MNEWKNGILIRALPGPMHLDLRTGPLSPCSITKLEEPCSFIREWMSAGLALPHTGTGWCSIVHA